MIFTHFFVSHEEADLSNYEWLVVMKTTSVVPAIFPKAMAYAATSSCLTRCTCVFPASGLLFLMCQLFISFIYSHRKGRSVSALTLIPYREKGRTFDRSVRYKSDEVYAVLDDIDAFLKESALGVGAILRINLCCEELMTNIAIHSHGHVVHHSFDVHIYSDNHGVCVALKDGGKPFNPIMTG